MLRELPKFKFIVLTLCAATLFTSFLDDVSARQRQEDFMLVSIACGAVSMYTYRMPNGEKLYLKEMSFQSLELAEGALEKKLASAEKIVERAPVFDERGDKVGERAMAVFGNNSVVLRASKYRFDSIEASSLEIVLAFEKWEKEMKKRLTRRGPKTQ